MIDIIIPTIKSEYDVREMAADIKKNTKIEYNLIITAQPISAAKNRNIGLSKSNTSIVVMMDDDITGFYEGWLQDLIKPIAGNMEIGIVSARLCSLDMRMAMAMGMDEYNHPMYPLIFDADKKRVTTACIAFRNLGIKFDENYIGSGWEDTDFCMQWNMKYPDKRIVVNNGCIIKHINEAKNQSGYNWEHNRNIFIKKWGEESL